ncbi:PBS lyase [Phycicoccus flavus]|uniref:PBS lyase n=1 Tax=Phycicoccus flavus TaxID=2502783 RepID=UPI000FEB7F60|nr:PBS lyase [Phycicoccus flavus]NHA69040.1 PBS lyase [Phycicoccus flavus]
MTTISSRTTQFTEGIQALVPPPPSRYNDPAEHIDFIRPLADNYLPFDVRSKKTLLEAVKEEATEMERERALWELSDRLGPEALHHVQNFIQVESSRDLRQGGLWLVMQLLGQASMPVLEEYFMDDDPEVADYARVMYGDLSGVSQTRVYSQVEVEDGHHFDQTVPLMISGQVIVDSDTGPTRARLSPLWFDSILGKVTACTNADTIATNLVIEKALEGLHADGSTHYEVFPFRGTSVSYADRLMEHTYASETIRPFYPSGVVEDGPSIPIPVNLVRCAVTSIADLGDWTIHGSQRAEKLQGHERPFVTAVRGRFAGWAASDMDRITEEGVRAGLVQLSSTCHEIAGPMTNTKVFGIFRGKPMDRTGNGRLSLNGYKAHGDEAGRMDYYADGSMAADPLHH